MGEVPDADEIEVNYTMNDSTPRVSYVMRHKDLSKLKGTAKDVKGHLQGYDGTFYVRDSMRGESDELHMQLLPGAEKLGLTLAQVSMQLRRLILVKKFSGCHGKPVTLW